METVNPMKKILFRWFGFGAAFDIAHKDIQDCNEIKSVLTMFAEKRMSLTEFEQLFVSNMGGLKRSVIWRCAPRRPRKIRRL